MDTILVTACRHKRKSHMTSKFIPKVSSKCQKEPTQQIEFLGMMIPSKKMKIYLPKVKIEKIKRKKCRYALAPQPHSQTDVMQACSDPDGQNLQTS